MKTAASLITNFSIPQSVASPRSTVATQVYRTIRDGIISLRLTPGMSMSEQEMAAALGVSRTPVREAFIRLSREGLVEIYPQRATVVSKISLKRVRQERFLRESLESSVLLSFIENPTQSGLDLMQEQIERQRECLHSGDYGTFLECDDRFHFVLYEETDNLLCGQVIRRNCHDYQRLRALSDSVNREVQQLNIKQHMEMLDGIRRHDAAQAQQTLRTHVRRLLNETAGLRAQKPEFITD